MRENTLIGFASTAQEKKASEESKQMTNSFFIVFIVCSLYICSPSFFCFPFLNDKYRLLPPTGRRVISSQTGGERLYYSWPMAVVFAVCLSATFWTTHRRHEATTLSLLVLRCRFGASGS